MRLHGDLPGWERAEREAHQYNLDASARQGSDGERPLRRTETQEPTMTMEEFRNRIREIFAAKGSAT